MDQSYDASCIVREESPSAKLKFETFKFGKGLPSSLSQNQPKSNHGRTHSRSHSRNGSVSSSVPALNIQLPNLSGDRPTSQPVNMGASKRNSHHRRRSSVSTRRESADLMGVSLPELPVSSSEDNINFGDKDSIRRRALMALEGKPDVSFTKVEIPELSTPDMEKRMFDFPTKPSFPPGSGFSSGLGSGKRDSFKLLASSASSKDHLQTLVEEEEEEEVETSSTLDGDQSSSDGTTEILSAPTVTLAKASSTRPRPKTLNLRPLSLTPENLVSGTSGLPTPPPNSRPGLRSLSLAASTNLQSFLGAGSNDVSATQTSTIAQRRRSLAWTPSLTPPSRPPLTLDCESSPEEITLKRRSIPYRFFGHGLPTPEMTPVTDRRYSSASSSDEESVSGRPLSTAEQHFLFKSHNALLARITDLERALSSRSRSRSVSVASDSSSTTANEPSDEMLQLISDLKSERDELKRDADGWRTRVEDLNKQINILGKRVEAERRDAWVARSRLGLLEVEKTGLEKALQEKTALVEESLAKFEALELERTRLVNTIKSLETQNMVTQSSTEEECESLRIELSEERAKREALERALEKTRGLGLTSVGSNSSSTFAESVQEPTTSLKVVDEEDEEEDGLAGYEDEEDSDVSFESPGGSSVGSVDELNRPFNPTPFSSATSEIESAVRQATHVPKSSLSRTWTFPKNVVVTPELSEAKEEVDRFFGCLSSVESSQPLEEAFSLEVSKSMFSRGFGALDDTEDSPFFIPSNVGVEATTPTQLEVVVEEDEGVEDLGDDNNACAGVFGQDLGGITITFTPPESGTTSASINPFESPEDELQKRAVSPAIASPPRTSSSPSGIPRASPKSLSGNGVVLKSVTPPAKRGGNMPSFIPQPVTSPTRNSPKQAAPTFARQPQRKPAPLLPSLNKIPSGVTNGSTFKTQSTTSSLISQRQRIPRLQK